MIKELGDFSQGVVKSSLLGAKRKRIWLKLLSKYCELSEYDIVDDYELASKELDHYIEYYRKSMQPVVHKFISTMSNDIELYDQIVAFIYKEKEDSPTQEQVKEEANLFLRILPLYFLGIDQIIEMDEEIEKASAELSLSSDRVRNEAKLKITTTVETTKDITYDMVVATQVGIKGMKPIVKKGIQDSIPVAKQYVKDLKNSFRRK